jgi:hypothetical protein
MWRKQESGRMTDGRSRKTRQNPCGIKYYSHLYHYYMFIFIKYSDLCLFLPYDLHERKLDYPPFTYHRRLPMMKLAIRIFVLSVVVAGAGAAAATSKTALIASSSHQSATASVPLPICGAGHTYCHVVSPSQDN